MSQEKEAPSSYRSFAGRILNITGGGGDIGLCTARRFAGRGATVALVDVKREAVEQGAAEIRKTGSEASAHVCDVSSEDEVSEVVSEIRKLHGSVDFLFNNAGYQGDFTPTHLYTIEDYRRVIEINLVGAFIVLRTVAALMVEANFGRIVNMASRAGTFGPPNMAAYTASKAGVIGLTKTAAKDLAPHNVRVNSVGPALLGPGTMWQRQVEKQAAAASQYFSKDPAQVEGQMINGVPMRRLGTHNEVASVVEFLMSEEASYITGAHIPIGGGLS